ncbi:MAG: hypothetical protein R3B95_19565 [Nitrospirales bacterium]|nr:hypothetical protein [Nitrospirales bacterium]
MKPRMDPLDVIVAVGMFATMVGGLFLVVASYGSWGVPTPRKTDNPMTAMSVMRSLQTSMGEGIVEVAKLNYGFSNSIDRVTASQAHAFRNLDALNKMPPIPEVVQSRFAQAQAEREGRLQYLMGKSIVTLTGQGVRSGVLTANTLNGPVNDRIIKTAAKYGALGQERGNGQNQAVLGQWISQESSSRQRLHALLQGRMGEAIVQKASIEHAYGETKAGLQNQLQALTAAAIRSEVPGMRLAQLPQSEQGMQGSIGPQTSAAGTQVSFSELWSSDRAFMTYGIAFLILLPGLLIWSLTFPRVPLEKPVNMDRILELTMELMPRRPVKIHHWS